MGLFFSHFSKPSRGGRLQRFPDCSHRLCHFGFDDKRPFFLFWRSASGVPIGRDPVRLSYLIGTYWNYEETLSWLTMECATERHLVVQSIVKWPWDFLNSPHFFSLANFFQRTKAVIHIRPTNWNDFQTWISPYTTNPVRLSIHSKTRSRVCISSQQKKLNIRQEKQTKDQL